MRWFRRTPLEAARWVIVDCETSGLDPARDRLLTVGAVAVTHGRIDLAHAFEASVKQRVPSAPENILVHGIGAEAQLAGLPAHDVIKGLADHVGDAIPVGFHAPFDAAVLGRYGFRAGEQWLDLAQLMPALFARRNAQTLEDWLVEFDIAIQSRHDALGDAFSTAQLLLVVLAEAKRQAIGTVEGLRRAQRHRRWLA